MKTTAYIRKQEAKDISFEYYERREYFTLFDIMEKHCIKMYGEIDHIEFTDNYIKIYDTGKRNQYRDFKLKTMKT